MGYAITWCAVREADAEEFLAHFGLKPTGEKEEWPESPVATALLNTGWQIIWFNEYAPKSLRSENLRAISLQFDLLLCLVEEHVMASSSEFWVNGSRKWYLSHEGENGPKGLVSEGALPETFSEIRHEMEEAQIEEGGDAAEVDYIFEIPLKVAQSLVGFKHDEDCPHLVDGQFAVLSNPEQKVGWWRRLLHK